MMQTLAPEVAAVNAQFRAPLTEAGLTGRGSSLVPDLEASKQSAISNLFFKERPQAADKLTSIAQNLMSLGTQQAGMGGSILGDAAQETLNYNAIIRGLQMQQAQMPSALGQLGTSLGPILAQVLGGVLGGSGSSGPDYGPGGLQPPPIVMPDPGSYSGGDSMTSSGFNPSTLNALLSSSQGKPDFDASWLDKG